MAVCAGCGQDNEPDSEFCRGCRRYLGWNAGRTSPADTAPAPVFEEPAPVVGIQVEPTMPKLNQAVTVYAENPTVGAQVERQRLQSISVSAAPGRTAPGNQAGQVASDGNQGLMFSTDIHRLDLVPGGTAVVTAQLRNKGTVVDAMTIDVIGLPPEWVTIEARTVNLFVGADATVRIRISPPVHHSTQRGLIAAEVAAWSGTNPNVRCVQRLDVNVAAFSDIDARITPAISVGRFEGKFSIAVSNGGNSKLEATVRGSHDEGAVTVLCRPSRLTVAPGGKASASVIAKPPFLFTGKPVVYNLVVSVGTDSNSRDFPVKLKQPPLLSKWAARILTVALVVVIAVAAVLIFHNHKAKLPSKPHAAARTIPAYTASAAPYFPHPSAPNDEVTQ